MNTYFRTISAVGLLVAAVALFPQSAFAARIQASTISNSTTEAGDSATFTITLDEPIVGMTDSEVTIPISSNTTSEGTVEVTEVLFTADNWFVPQTVTVQGVDDDIDDGDIAYNIVLGAAVSDSEYYNGFNAADVSATNIDNDAAGVNVTATDTLVEGEAPEELSFVLQSEPTQDVTVTLVGDSCLTLNDSSLVFTSGNWNVPQIVTVAASRADDDLHQPNENCLVQVTTASDDPLYDGVIVPDITYTIEDDMPLAIVTFSNSQNEYTTTYNDGTTYTFQAFPGVGYTSYAFDTANKAMIISNGKFIRVFVEGELISEQRVNKYPKAEDQFQLDVSKLYDTKNYDTVSLVSTSDTGVKLTTFRLNIDKELANKKEGRATYQAREHLQLEADSVTKFISAQVGSDSENYTEYKWLLTQKGSLILKQAVTFQAL